MIASPLGKLLLAAGLIMLSVYLWLPSFAAIARGNRNAPYILVVNAVFLYSYAEWRKLLALAADKASRPSLPERLKPVGARSLAASILGSLLVWAVLTAGLAILPIVG